MTGTYEASKKRGFTDCSTEMFYVDYIQPGQPKKAPFFLRTDDQLSVLFKSKAKSILLRVTQRIVQFEKGSVNISMEKDKKSCEVELSSMCTHSSVSSNSKSLKDMEYFKRDTFSLYEYALIFGSSVEEAVKRVSKWAAAFYTHPASYYTLPSTNVVTLPKISIPKPAVLQVLKRNEETLMRSWAKKHGKSVRQRNVRQDNTKDRAGTLPLILYESETILNPLNLQLATTGVIPDITESLDNEVREKHTTEQPEPIDTYIESDSDTDSGDENEHAAQTVISVMQPTRLGRTRRITQRMIDYLQSEIDT